MNEASPDAPTITRELAALGEDAPSEAELGLVGEAVHDTPEVAMVERLDELSEPISFEPLSELELHRVWREVEQGLDGEDQPTGGAPTESRPTGPSSPRWLYAAVGLAAAAVLALLVIPRGPKSELAGQTEGPSELDAAEVSEQGEAVRAALAALDDGRSDTARAEDRVAAYRRQLEERGG